MTWTRAKNGADRSSNGTTPALSISVASSKHSSAVFAVQSGHGCSPGLLEPPSYTSPG